MAISPEEFNKRISDAARISGAYNAKTGENANGGVKIPTPPSRSKDEEDSIALANSRYAARSTGVAATNQAMKDSQQAARTNYVPPMPPDQKPVGAAVGTPVYYSSAWSPRTSDLQRQAEVEQQKKRDALMNSATTAKTSIKNDFDRGQQITRDNRVLSNLAFARNANPFSGQYAHKKDMIQREQLLSDEAMTKQLNNQLAQYDREIQQFEARSPDEIQARLNDLQKEAQDLLMRQQQLSMQEGQLTGTYQGKPTLAAQQQSFNQQYTNERFGMEKRAQHIAEAKDLSERFGIFVEPTEDYSNMLDQVRGRTPVAQQTAEEKRQDALKKEAWDAADMFGHVPEAYAEILGIPAGTQTQKAKEFAMENAIKERNAKTAEKNANTAALNATKQEQPKTTSTSYKSSPEFAADMKVILTDTANAARVLTENADEFINKYGYDGYLDLKRALDAQLKSTQP